MAWILKKNKFSQILTALAVIIGLLSVILLGFKVYSLFFENFEETEKIDQTTYQAVFLTNNQIYFGKLKDISSQYPVLIDVYYVKLESPEATIGNLVKLGETEPHGPKNEMILNREHILFWENLSLDSKIVKTINQLKQ